MRRIEWRKKNPRRKALGSDAVLIASQLHRVGEHRENAYINTL